MLRPARPTSTRASRPVIHRLVPSAAATRPSRVDAYFHVTRGGRARSRSASRARARRHRRRARRRGPRPRRRAAPAPAAGPGPGSLLAWTTRATPAAISASMHGPVRPVCARLEAHVGGRARARSPAASSATTSACAVPAPWCQPSPTTCGPSGPSATRTAPTRGWGRRRGRAAPARGRAAPTARHHQARSPWVLLPSPSPGSGGSREGAQATGAHSAPVTTCCLPSGLSPSVEESHLVNRSLAASGSRTVTAGSELHRPRSTYASTVARAGRLGRDVSTPEGGERPRGG